MAFLKEEFARRQAEAETDLQIAGTPHPQKNKIPCG
jgi:hypothetical protein